MFHSSKSYITGYAAFGTIIRADIESWQIFLLSNHIL